MANSLAHTKWVCKYHIVFTPKYRRKIIYNQLRKDIQQIIRDLCILSIPPKMSVSSFMGYLKGKSSTMLYEQFGELKYKYRNREFWCRGYYVDTVGKNESRIAEYVRNQLKEDEMGEQLRIPSNSPFTGGK